MNEQILEIRYKPNARILDYRGELAAAISEQLNLPRWQISRDRVDVFDETTHRRRAFVSHNRLGFTVQDAPTPNYFGDKAGQFLRLISGIEYVGDRWEVIRLGVRARFLEPAEGVSFEEAVLRFLRRFSEVTPEAQEAIGADIEDFGLTLELRDELGWFKQQVGPMAAEQSTQILKDRDDYPDVGIYCDIDHAKKNETVTANEAVRYLKATSQAAWNRRDRIVAVLLGT